MPELRRLWAGDTLITDTVSRRSPACATSRSRLHGTQITDAGLVGLKGLVRLRKLNLMGTTVSDSGLENLGELNKLQELNLYRTKVPTPDSIV